MQRMIAGVLLLQMTGYDVDGRFIVSINRAGDKARDVDGIDCDWIAPR